MNVQFKQTQQTDLVLSSAHLLSEYSSINYMKTTPTAFQKRKNKKREDFFHTKCISDFIRKSVCLAKRWDRLRVVDLPNALRPLKKAAVLAGNE